MQTIVKIDPDQQQALLDAIGSVTGATQEATNYTYTIQEQMNGVLVYQIQQMQFLQNVYTALVVVAFVQLFMIGWRVYDLSTSHHRTSGDVGLQRR